MGALGTDTAEVLEIKTISFTVTRHIRPKKRCSKCAVIVQAPAPARPIEESFAGASLLALVPRSKYFRPEREWPSGYFTHGTRAPLQGTHNNTTERCVHGIAVGKKNYLFFGPDTGGERAANYAERPHSRGYFPGVFHRLIRHSLITSPASTKRRGHDYCHIYQEAEALAPPP